MSTPTSAGRETRYASAAGARNHSAATTSATAPTRRYAALTAAALTTMAATAFLAPAQQAAAAAAPVESAQASAAIAELAAGAPDALTAIPADFVASFGYRPSTVDGVLVNPRGDCSSPVTLPVEFDTACKAHDLGYDLLRYADQRGEPLGPWARQALDATLDRQMHQACAARVDSFSRARCDAMASIANTAVDLNSRRQDYGAPVVEPLLDTADTGPATSGALLGVLGSGLAGLIAALVVRNRRRDPAQVADLSYHHAAVRP
ncbi:hypothetical protein IU427_16335 [Nocardia beijingensis]|uniref:hypothetical protein n=1 Tax=Nocardia beijingensis TaxID=95162 RepID=UPI0018944DC6|nr:hypothetical protein [Nocardia beijingensis]MBF6466735.1 hypothetical protein [Nocardia beijingensis]